MRTFIRRFWPLFAALAIVATPAIAQIVSTSFASYAVTAGTATTATTATVATTVTATATGTNAAFFPTFVASSTTGNRGVGMDAGLAYNPSTNVLAIDMTPVASPAYYAKLQVKAQSGGNAIAMYTNTGAAGAVNIDFYSQTASGIGSQIVGVPGAGGGDLQFWTNASAAGAPVITITSAGTLVYTAAPPGAAAGDIPLCMSTTNVTHTAAATCGVSVLEAKMNVEPLSEWLKKTTGKSCLDYAREMQAVKFDWKFNKAEDYGFIADWMEKIDPVLTTHEGEKLTNFKDRAVLAVTMCALRESDERIAKIETAMGL